MSGGIECDDDSAELLRDLTGVVNKINVVKERMKRTAPGLTTTTTTAPGLTTTTTLPVMTTPTSALSSSDSDEDEASYSDDLEKLHERK